MTEQLVHRDPRIAVLIDADNVPYAYISEMLAEITRYGIPTYKRIYADWTKPNAGGWKKVLLEHAITPIQQYSYTTGKNATDSALIIDAMDILYSGRVDGFCIVSSDSDFTRLATRLREAGMKVIGIGEKKTPLPFITACEKFIYIEILASNAEDEVTEDKDQPLKPTQRKKNAVSKVDKKLEKLIANNIEDLADEDGWTFLGELGSMLLKKRPDFDPRNFGFSKLGPLIKSINRFEVDERQVGKGKVKHVYVRNKPSKNA